jgi:DUF4097 and DUF4098 domain-containing protein YvlB
MSMEEERLMILQMVAEKKITPAEGAELLRALEESAREQGEEPEKRSGQQAGHASHARHQALAEEVRRTAREAAERVSANAQQMAKDAASAAAAVTRREGMLGSLIDRLADAFSFEFDDNRVSFEETIEGTFTADQPRLKLATGNGKLELHGWEEPGYRIILRYRVRGASGEEEARERAKGRIRFEATGDGITLDSETGSFIDRGISVSAQLWLPASHVYDLHGTTGNGSLTLESLALSEGELTSGNGSIKVEGVRASGLDVTTGNGGIRVEGDVARFTGSTGNGSLRFRPTGTGDQQAEISTGNGSATIDLSELPPSTGYRFDLSTGMGGIHCQLEDLVTEKNVKAMGHKHMVARSRNWESAATRVGIKASTGLGSVTVE